MAEQPRVSVIIPAYNANWSIARTVRSVLQQSFVDFEVVIVDDGSSERPQAVLGDLLGRDGRIRIVRQDNKGLAAARNRGVAEARAPLVAPLDADDLWHPDYLLALVEALDQQPDAPFAFAYCFRIDRDDRLISKTDYPSPPRHDFLGLLSVNSVGCGSAAVFRRAALQAAGGYDESLRARGLEGAEDWKLVLALASRAQPCLVPRNLVGYRLTAQSMSQANPRRQFAAVMTVLEHAQAAYPETPSRWFADSRTMMTAWLLPAFLKKGDFLFAFGLAVRAYLLNPLWFRNASVWSVHQSKLILALGALAGIVNGRRAKKPRLWEAEFEGGHPFRYMAADAVPAVDEGR
jgi:glycosyltransferase involved in cell wall biosynthesis